MIAYHFHPDLAIGAQRTNKYAKYLPQYGWQPYVLSVDPRRYGQQDNSPAEFDCPLYRISQWPVPDDIHMKFRNFLTKIGL